MNYQSIAIAGLPGSGKTTLGKKLSEATGWDYFPIGQLFRRRHELIFKNGDTKKPFEDWWAQEVTNADIIAINREAHERLAYGEKILDSRYAVENARHVSHTLLVFVKAPLIVRAQRAFDSGEYKERGITTLEKTIEFLDQREKDEARRGQEIFKYDYRNEKLYDLILDTNMLSLEDEVELITDFITS
ncbi:MAG: cytidylate kinase family protein [Nanoarchaeota archaeon]